MSRVDDLTEGPVWRLIARLALPMVLGIVAVQSISLADTFFIGKLGSTQLAALSFSFPVALTFGAFSLGLSAGAGSVVSRAFGAGEEEEEGRRLARDAILLSSALLLIVIAIAVPTTEPLFAALGASDDALGHIVDYMRILYLSMPLLVVLMVINSVIRAAGDSRWPSATMVASGVMNVGLTALLVFGWGPVPAFEVAGAAWATFIARALSFALCVWVVVSIKDLVLLEWPSVDELLDSATRMAKVALPTSAGNAINPIGVAVVTAVLASVGQEAVAGYGVANRIEAFSAIPMFAMSAAMASFAGQNWGAEEVARVRTALKQTYVASLAWAALIATLLWFFGDAISGVFSDDDAVREQATLYLQIVPASIAGYGVVIITANTFAAVDRSLRGVAAHALRSFVLIVPGAWIAASVADARWVYIVIAVSNVLAGLAAAWYALNWFANADERCAEDAARGDDSTYCEEGASYCN